MKPRGFFYLCLSHE